MSKTIKKLLVISALFSAILPIGSPVAEARPGGKCAKVGQVRTFSGEQYRCTASRKGGKTLNSWVKIAGGRATPTTTTTTTTLPPVVVTEMNVDCGPSFENSKYPRFQLDQLLLKPDTQSVFTYLTTETCLINTTWTPSADPAVNASREIFLCIESLDTYPTNQSMVIRCAYDKPTKMPASGQHQFGMWKDHREGEPLYGFVIVQIKGYLDGKVEPEWTSKRHLIFYDIDPSRLPNPDSFFYGQLNDVRYASS
jgi:hypothetical protein